MPDNAEQIQAPIEDVYSVDRTGAAATASVDGLVVGVVDGAAAVDEEGLYDQLTSALEIPDHFGRNWNALNEVLRDLSWFPELSGTVLVIEHPDSFLSAGDEDLQTFVEVLEAVTDKWSRPYAPGKPWGRPAAPFRVVLSGADIDLQRWRDAGAPLPADID